MINIVLLKTNVIINVNLIDDLEMCLVLNIIVNTIIIFIFIYLQKLTTTSLYV